MLDNIFAGDFKNIRDVESEFELPTGMLENITIIYAVYNQPQYEGYAEVYFKDNLTGLYYEVHGSHCSCYGLENQWSPELIGDKDAFLAYANRVEVMTAQKDYYFEGHVPLIQIIG